MFKEANSLLRYLIIKLHTIFIWEYLVVSAYFVENKFEN